jgi:hypothetical protein
MHKVVKFLWSIVVAVALWVYKVSGVEYIVEEVRSACFLYKLKLRMVPVSYKLFLFFWGIAFGGSAMFVHLEYGDILEPNTIIIENSRVFPVEAKAPNLEEVEEKSSRSIDELADYIWSKESTRGKNNFSKCDTIGKVNGVGYDIPGDGSYVCFDSHEEEMQVLKGWLTYRKALGWSELKMLCTYSGNNYGECKK